MANKPRKSILLDKMPQVFTDAGRNGRETVVDDTANITQGSFKGSHIDQFDTH